MVVQHNLQAINANRMLNVTSSGQAKATEKLSSGYKINRAADDAAGLAISEKMRKQMRGLDRASTNAQDGVSAVQTAEGALNEVHDMLQRLNELAVQAANGTNSLSDRESIQDEITELTTEIDRVSETTRFNETELLKGALGTRTKVLVGHDAGIKGTFVDRVTNASLTVDLTTGTTIVIGGNTYNIVHADSKNLNEKYTTDKSMDAVQYLQEKITAAEAQEKAEVTINGTVYTHPKDANGTVLKNMWTAGTGDEYTTDQLRGKVKDGAKVLIDDEGDGKPEIEQVARDYKDKKNITAGQAAELITTALRQANNIGADSDKMSKVAMRSSNGTLSAVTSRSAVVFDITKGITTVPNVLSFNLHVGADADMGNKIMLNIDGMTCAGLGIKDLNIADDSGIAATYAIDAIADALQVVSAQRANLGAIQNRLEHTIANLDNVVENTTAAESRIRDTDMAEEMVEYSKNNILQQAGQSMLAQANQSTQGVLSLLQG